MCAHIPLPRQPRGCSPAAALHSSTPTGPKAILHAKECWFVRVQFVSVSACQRVTTCKPRRHTQANSCAAPAMFQQQQQGMLLLSMQSSNHSHHCTTPTKPELQGQARREAARLPTTANNNQTTTCKATQQQSAAVGPVYSLIPVHTATSLRQRSHA